MQEAGGLVLQPVMKVRVVVPDENTGAVLGDLQSRGAPIRLGVWDCGFGFALRNASLSGSALPLR